MSLLCILWFLCLIIYTVLDHTDRYSITNTFLLMNGGDYMKGAAWDCKFEIEAFHKSPTKVQFDRPSPS